MKFVTFVRGGRRLRVPLILAVTLMVFVAGCDWPMFGSGADHSHNAPNEPFTPSNAASVSQAWTATTGDAVVSSPAVANGIVYVGSNDHKLYALDAAGNTNCKASPTNSSPTICSPLWTATTGGAVRSSPAVANSVVYVGSNDDTLYAFDAGGTTNCTGGSPPKTCTPLWTATTSGSVDSSPAVANGVVYVGSTDGKLYAFDAAGNTNCSAGNPRTCTPLWTATTGGAVRSSPAVANGVVYIGSDDL